jgi:spermidine synthase
VSATRVVPARRAVVLFSLFVSGAAGLGYEIAWTRMLAVGLGHEAPSVLAVLAAFFGGFALGAWALDGVLRRSRFPERWYASLEATIGVWALATTVIVPAVNDQVALLTGTTPSPIRHWLVAFGLPFIALLPATAAMGATLPAVDRLIAKLGDRGRSLGLVYSINTLGAVAGTLAVTFVALPASGFRATIGVLAAVQMMSGATVLLAVPKDGERDRPAREDAGAPDVHRGASGAVTLFVVGLLGVGYEVLGMRVLGQVLENTIYTFASALSIYLLGTAAGAGLYHVLVARMIRSFDRVRAWLLVGLALACAVGVLALSRAAAIYDGLRNVAGQQFLGAILTEMATAAAVFGLPTLLMGALFSHLAIRARPELGVGRALALNTLGGALAPLLFGVLLLPVLGAEISLVALACGYLCLVERPVLVRVGPAALAVLAGVSWVADLRLIRPPSGGHVLAGGYQEGVMGTAVAVTDASGDRWLKLHDRFTEGGTGGAFGERRQAHIPLLLHPAPKRALFLGLGAGVTFGAVADHRDVRADGVELLSEVVELLPFFAQANGDPSRAPRLTVHVADARRYVKASTSQYDVIVADLFHPARDGAGGMYTVEHFRAVRDRLAPGGLFAQWLPLYQHDIGTLLAVARTFRDVFPDSYAVLAHFNVTTPAVALIGGDVRVEPRQGFLAQRVKDPQLTRALEGAGFRDDLDLFGSVLAEPDALARLAGSGPVGTDDRPLVTFTAPRTTYEGTRPPFEVLRAMLDQFEGQAKRTPDSGSASQSFPDRLADYRRARDLYLRAEMDWLTGYRQGAIDNQLAAVRASADFRTAYDLLLIRARGSVRQNRAETLAILRGLQQARPEREEAGRLLQSIRP